MNAKILLVLTIILFPSTTYAARHALLIGIGDYAEIEDLEGPIHDVDALRTELPRWGFDRSNIHTLTNAEATRTGILAAIDRLAETSRAGDFIVLYYSGHGTSAVDPEARHLGLPSRTGALIPYDFQASFSEDPKKSRENLILGRRDLLPRLKRLDQDRRVFVVFDACFSGYSIRSLDSPPARSFPLAGFYRSPEPFLADEPFPEEAPFGRATDRSAYPYTNLLYLAAAGWSERAEDIPRRHLRTTPTIDGRPHGALTNAFLEGLQDIADTEQGESPTYRELFEFVRKRVVARHDHTPRFLYPPAMPELTEQPVFGPEPQQKEALPKNADGLGELLAMISPDAKSNLHLQLPALSDADRTDGRFELLLTAAEPAWFLLLNIDSTGYVSVLVPRPGQKEVASRKHRDAFRATPPYGREHLLAFAFRERPKAFDDWKGKGFSVEDPRFEEFLRFLREPREWKAHARLDLVTGKGLKVREGEP